MEPETTSQANVVEEIGSPPADVPNPSIMSILLPRETRLAPPNESDEERLQCLIPGLIRFSTTQRRSSS